MDASLKTAIIIFCLILGQGVKELFTRIGYEDKTYMLGYVIGCITILLSTEL